MGIVLFTLYILIQQTSSFTPEDDQILSDRQYSPAFSPSSDIYLLFGQSLQLNCSVPQSQTNHQRNCSVAHIKINHQRNCSVAQGQINHQRNCSVAQSQIKQQQNCSLGNSSVNTDLKCSNNESSQIFDINKLKILYCNTDSRDSCRTQTTKQVDNRTIALYRPNVSISDVGTFFCQYNNSGQTEAASYLRVGYKPYGPENITCVSPDLMDLNCSWVKSELDSKNPFPVRYSSYFKSRPQYGRFDCPHPRPNSCSIRSQRTKGEKYTFSKFLRYTLYINASNCCESNIKQYEIDNNDIVRFTPPVITALQSDSRNITTVMDLTSYTEYSLNVLTSIYYEVSYRSIYSESTINFISPNTTNITVIIPDLIPYTAYTIDIRMRVINCIRDCKWSNTVTKTQKTRKAVPDVLPDLIPSCYHRLDGSVFIYVKPIRIRDKYSDDAYYQVKVEDTNNAKISRLFNVSFANTTINVTSLPYKFNYNINLKTINDIGESRKSQTIIIPAYNSAKILPQNIVVERSANNYTVWWKSGISTTTELEAITVYWCHGNKNNYICKSDLNWIMVQNNQTTMTIYELADKLGGDWMFSVAFQYTDGYNTGMVFSDCYFPSVAEAPKAVQPFNAIPKSETEIEITPLEYCSKQNPSMPLFYVVYYKSNAGNNTVCDKSFTNKTVSAQFGTQNLTIGNLKPSTGYKVCLGVITKGGNITSKPVHALTLTTVKEKSVAVYQIVLGVIGAVILVIICMVILLKLRKKWKQPIDFILPQIKSSNYAKVPDHEKENQFKELSLSEKGSSDSGVASNGVSESSITSHNNGKESDTNSKSVTKLSDSSTEVNEVQNQTRDGESGDEDSTHEEFLIKERSSSNLTESDGYNEYSLKSSRSPSTHKSSLSSSNKSKKFQRPSLEGVFEDPITKENRMKSELTLKNSNNFKSDDYKQERTKVWVSKSNENLQIHDTNLNSQCDQNSAQRIHGGIVQEYVEVDLEGSVKSESVGQNSQNINRIDEQGFEHKSGKVKVCDNIKDVINSTIVHVESEGIRINNGGKERTQTLQVCKTPERSVLNSRTIVEIKNNDNKSKLIDGTIEVISDKEAINTSLLNVQINKTNRENINANMHPNVLPKLVDEAQNSHENSTSGVSDYLQVDDSNSYPHSRTISDYLQVGENSSDQHSSETFDL